MRVRGAGTAWLGALALAAALGLAACGGGTGSTSGGTTSEGTAKGAGLVAAYCLYRSDTKAEALACDARTDPARVRAANDEAGRWARGEIQACGKGAGKLCEELAGAILRSSIGREAH